MRFGDGGSSVNYTKFIFQVVVDAQIEIVISNPQEEEHMLTIMGTKDGVLKEVGVLQSTKTAETVSYKKSNQKIQAQQPDHHKT